MTTKQASVKRRCAGCSKVIAGRPNKRYCSDDCRESALNRRRYQRRKGGEKVTTLSGSIPSVIPGSNGMVIAAAARLGYLGGPTSTVLDVTHGRGLWWTRHRPPGLVFNGDDFRHRSEADDSVEIVCYDPPYISTGSRAKSSIDDFYDRFGLGELNGWREIRQLIDDGLAECARILAPRGYLLVKCMDYVESGRKVWNTFHVVAEGERLGLRLVDRFHHLTGGGAQPMDNVDGSPREQKHAREVASMLLVFTK